MSDLIGKEKLDAKLKRLQDPRLLNAALTAAALTLQSKVAPYPASTAANRPGRFTPIKSSKKYGAGWKLRDTISGGRPMGYYERGRGWWYPVVRRYNLRSFGNYGKSLGVIRASETQRATGSVAGYKLSRSNQSQTLNRRWTVYSKSQTVVALANNATYARYLHDEKKQAKIAERREWKAYQVVWRQHGKAIMDKARLEYAKVIRAQ